MYLFIITIYHKKGFIMFFCQILKKASLKNEKLNRITIVTRPKVYTKFIKDEETNQ